MKQEKFLLVGDRRACENYGAIATCEELIELMRPRRLSLIPITRMDQDYEYMPLDFGDFEDFAKKTNNTVFYAEKRALANADRVVINCEGTLTHHTNASRCGPGYRARARYELFIAYYATKHLGKQVDIINHCVDPGNASAEEIIKETYPLVTNCWVRDYTSIDNLKMLGIKHAETVPDALYNFYNHEAPIADRHYICLGDSATLGNVSWNVNNFYTELIERLHSKGEEVVFIDGNMWKTTDTIRSLCQDLGVRWLHVDNTHWRDLARVLARSKVFFSGRWHASILATVSGTPSILFGSDSHKTKDLHTQLKTGENFYEIESLPEKIDEIADRLSSIDCMTKKMLNLAERQRRFVRKCYAAL